MLCAALLCLCACAGAAPRFRNVVNEPFATVAGGPPGAIVVEDSAMSTAAAEASITRAIHAQHPVSALRRAEHSLRTLQRLGLKGPQARVCFPRRMVHLRDGDIVAGDLVETMQAGQALGDPGNELRFTFEGFSEADETSLRDYLSRALPVAYSVYGRPAFDLDVTVILDDDLDALQGGVYDASANEIRMTPLSGNLSEDTLILMVLVLQAFHDDAGLFYDAWEQGMAGAAATVIQTRSGVAPGYDPIDPGPFYALSVYEPQNQQTLGGPSFYPPSGWAGMLVWRVAMARAAWLKCWIEDSDFFRRFNAAYYDAFTETLPGDVPALRVLAAQVLPQVEGMPFQEWFQRQWVLDTSVRIGPGLFTWNIPLTQSVALIAEYFYTTHEGDEQPRGGQARTTYWSYDFRTSLYAEEGNSISIPTSGEGAGEGFLIPTFFNIGGPQNVTVQVDLDSIRLMLPFPYGERGFETGENNLYGSIIGATEGTIDVEGGSGLEDVVVDRGVWGDRITQGALSPRQLRITFINADEEQITRVFNVGWDSYVTFLPGGSQETLTHDWSADGTGIHMISFPLTPLTQDLPELLGISSDRLLVARWDPRMSGDSKYRIWPRTDPVAPGRGYWLRVFDDASVTLEGVAESEQRPVTVPLSVGWNMIGPPRVGAVAVQDLELQAGAEEAVGYAQAVEGGIIQDGVYGYSADEGYEQRDELTRFEGYWIRCLRADGALLRFPALDTAAAQRPSTKQTTADTCRWRLPLVVEAGGMRGSAWIGVADGACAGLDRRDLQAPPDFGPRVTVRLAPPGGGARFFSDVRPAGEGEYAVRVCSTLAGGPVRLRWPDMSEVPAELAPVLIDDAAGERVYMRTSAGYQMSAGADGLQRDLRIEITRRDDAPLMVTAMSAMQAGAGAHVTLTLSAPAEVEATVLNIAGRTVRRIGEGYRGTGTTTLSWDLRDGGGQLVPGGLYLVRVHARDDDGRQAQLLRPLQITR